MEFSKDQLKKFVEEKADRAVERLDKTPTTKLIVSVLVLFSVGTIVLGLLQVKSYLDKPFFADKLVEDKGKIRGPLELLQYIREQRENSRELLTLQQRDSDGDTLTDYQETYIYKTNPYSADSDNDGISDKEEVEKGTSEPVINTSTTEAQQPTPSSQVTDTLIEDVTSGINDMASSQAQAETTASSSDLSQLETLTEAQKEELRQYFQSLSAEELRLLLVEQGFPQDQVSALDDADLQKTLEALLKSL